MGEVGLIKGMRNKPLPGIINYSTQGYKKNSPDVDKPFNIINSDDITMKGVEFPVTGIGSDGKIINMKPGVEHYRFKGPVLEFKTK